MHGSLRFLIIFFSLVGLTACKKPNPEPETLDPIYKDLKALADSKKKELDEAIKKKDAAYAQLLKEKPNTLDLKLARSEYEKAKAKIASIEQQARYFSIRAQRRKAEDRVNYLEAFNKDQPWPPPDEYSAWKINRKLAEAPSAWGKDVPKLYDLPKKADKKTEKKAE